MTSLPLTDSAWRMACQEHFGVAAKLDLVRLARQGGSVKGAVGIVKFKRLLLDVPDQPSINGVQDLVSSASCDQAGLVWYEMIGSRQTGRRNRVQLRLQAVVDLVCQRCLSKMAFSVNERAEFELFEREKDLEAASADEEVDPQAPEPMLVQDPVDLADLIEDQLILAIPYVPKHDQCEPAQTSAGQAIEPSERESPFKVLEGFKADSGNPS